MQYTIRHVPRLKRIGLIFTISLGLGSPTNEYVSMYKGVSVDKVYTEKAVVQ